MHFLQKLKSLLVQSKLDVCSVLGELRQVFNTIWIPNRYLLWFRKVRQFLYTRVNFGKLLIGLLIHITKMFK